MKHLLKRLWQDESGATAIEYGLIVGIMAALLVAVLGMFGDKLKGLFAAIADMLGDATEQVSETSAVEK
ncbi:MAG: Flp family type IVb pilin [Desulfobacteraceae bacterium]|jgi:pilus assembly protein Flp/PilA